MSYIRQIMDYITEHQYIRRLLVLKMTTGIVSLCGAAFIVPDILAL